MRTTTPRSFLGPLVALAFAGCAPRPHMCGDRSECSASSACVAGRCQAEGPTLRASIDGSRRVVVRPVDLAYASAGDEDHAGAPSVVSLGPSAVLLVRFEVPLPDDATVVEAYLVLTRADEVDDDPAPLNLHATRIVEGWSGRSMAYARLPKLVDVRAPVTRVRSSGPRLVRLDIRELVRAWRRRDVRDHGVAVVAEGGPEGGAAGGPARGMAFATLVAEPYVELYLR